MFKLLQTCCLIFAGVFLANCSDGALGMRGSSAWYMTASEEDIKKFEDNGGSRRPITTSYNSSVMSIPASTSSRVSSSGRNIYNSDGSSSRISSNGRNIYNSDGSSSRISSNGRNIYNSDGSSGRISSNGRNIYNTDGSSSRISSNGRNIYNSDGTSCRISSSGRNMYCN